MVQTVEPVQIGLSAGARLERRGQSLQLFRRFLAHEVEMQDRGARRVIFVKDGRVEGEGRLEPQ